MIEIDGNDIEPMVSWGTNPSMTSKVSESIPTLADCKLKHERKALASALQYMGLKEGQAIEDIDDSTCVYRFLYELTN